MSTMKNKKQKGLLYGMIFLLLLTFIPQFSFAAVQNGDKATIAYQGVIKDIHGNTYHYNNPHVTTNARQHYKLIIAGEADRYCYCIDWEAALALDGEKLTAKSLNADNYWQTLSKRVRQGITLAAMYGWRTNADVTQEEPELKGQCTEGDLYLATQTIIWEYQVGDRTSPTSINRDEMKFAYDAIKGRSAEVAYNWVLKQMAHHTDSWSFSSRDEDNAPTLKLKWSKTEDYYALYGYKDTKEVPYAVKGMSPAGLIASGNPNTFIWNFKKATYGNQRYSFGKDIGYNEQMSFVWGGDAEGQAMYTGSTDLIDWYTNVTTDAKGKIALTKMFSKTIGDSDGLSSDVAVSYEANATFQVYNTKYSSYAQALASAYAEAATMTTNANGYAETDWLTAGTYIVKQVSGNSQNKFMKDKTIKIEENNKTYGINAGAGVLNDEIKLKLQIVKKDIETGKTIPLPGTTFKLKDRDGNWITQQKYDAEANGGEGGFINLDTFTTDQSGKVILPEEVKADVYYIHELKAPNGYVKSNNPLRIEISQNTEVVLEGKLAVFGFGNQPQKGKFHIQKVDETDKAVPYAVFDIVAAVDITTPDGTVRAKKGDIAQQDIMVDEKGLATSSELYLGKYSFIEKAIKIKVSKYTFTDENIIDILATYRTQKPSATDSEVEVIRVLLTDGVSAIDKLNAGDVIKGTKTGTSISDKTLIPILQETIKGLPATQVQQELQLDPDPAYVIPKDPIATVEIKYSNQDTAVNTVDVKLVNKKATGKVEITKTDVSTGDLIPDCGIQILDKDKKVIFKGRTDKNGKVSFGPLPLGNYYFQEFDAPKGYLIDEKTYPFVIKENGEIVKCQMTNKRITSNVEISKVDISTGDLIPDCGIQILDKNKKVLVEGRTDKSGKVTFGPLVPGKYYFKEFDAPKGYTLDDRAFQFTVKPDGKVIKCRMTNKMGGTPQTGDNSFLFLPLLLTLLLAAAMGGTILYKRKRTITK